MAEKDPSLYHMGKKRRSELPVVIIESDLDDENVRNMVVLLRKVKGKEQARAAIHNNGYLQITEVDDRHWELRAGFGKEAKLKMVLEWPLTTVILEKIHNAATAGRNAISGIFGRSPQE